jgi:hypothetical protein
MESKKDEGVIANALNDFLIRQEKAYFDLMREKIYIG